MHLNATQVEFLQRLGRSPEGQQLQELLNVEVADVNGKLRTLSGEDLYRAQGRASFLDEMLGRFVPKPPRPVRDSSSRLLPSDFR